jgi:F0F1-type ATP synthase delta subunit
MKQDRVKIYARALTEVLADEKADHKKVAENFLKLLVKAGQISKAKEIAAMAGDLLLKKQGKKKIVFETARKMTASQKKMAESFVGEGDRVFEKINPDLVAGIKIVVNGEKQIDASLLNKLNNLF